jgi:hypothetical protein
VKARSNRLTFIFASSSCSAYAPLRSVSLPRLWHSPSLSLPPFAVALRALPSPTLPRTVALLGKQLHCRMCACGHDNKDELNNIRRRRSISISFPPWSCHHQLLPHPPPRFLPHDLGLPNDRGVVDPRQRRLVRWRRRRGGRLRLSWRRWGRFVNA